MVSGVVSEGVAVVSGVVSEGVVVVDTQDAGRGVVSAWPVRDGASVRVKALPWLDC